ncbi:MAG: hypothetical protein NTU83_02320, partial [Candidatus Hydrogenedentes bacterium]|nr:hypothetical protein [Candidatus Hydrogenedentota bacterium]
MINRQALMAVSILITTAFYGLVLGVASVVPLYGLRPPPPKVSVPFHVQFREEKSVPPVASAHKKGNGTSLATRPEKIEDLLKREADVVKALDSALNKTAEVPNLAGRVA